MLVTQSCPTRCDPMDYGSPGSSCPWDSAGKNTGIGCYSLLQRIFPTQESCPVLLHCRQILYCLSYREDYIYIYISGPMVFHMNYYVMLPFHILFSNNTCLWVWITGEFASTISVSSYFVSMQRPQKSNGLNVNVTFLCIHTERNLTHSVWVVTPQTKVSSCFRELT